MGRKKRRGRQRGQPSGQLLRHRKLGKTSLGGLRLLPTGRLEPELRHGIYGDLRPLCGFQTSRQNPQDYPASGAAECRTLPSTLENFQRPFASMSPS